GSKLHDYRTLLFLCSGVSHFVLESKSHNKAFKSDSQRLAFFIPSLGFVFTVAWIRYGGSVAHTLVRRYVLDGFLRSKLRFH
ncbi:hypothetical protein, partial [Vibrio aestuarianus]|uniref:hypothetical protein n=1 Tax=Vibrio aestuarianus TaxID=28171 RepID=UPI00237CC8C3